MTASVYWIRHSEHTDCRTQGYVGFTSGKPAYRWKRHVREAQKGANTCRRLQDAIRRYKPENLVFGVLCVGDPAYCLDLEQRLRPAENIGWNIGCGGAQTQLGRKYTPEHCAKINAHKTGRVVTQETRDKIAATLRGNKNAAGSVRSEEYRRNLSLRATGFRHTEETKSRIGAASSARPRSKETRMKMRAARLALIAGKRLEP